MCREKEVQFYFDKLCNQELVELLNQFEEMPNTESEVFLCIKDYIWEEGTCYSDFFIVVPYLIRIASNLRIHESKDLWSYLGCWTATQEKYRVDISKDVLADFDLALAKAEKACIKQIMSVEKLNDQDAIYLYASLFSFAKHRFGYMTLAGYKDDIVGTSIAECPNGHVTDYSIYNSGIVCYEEHENPCKIPMNDDYNYILSSKSDNPWNEFIPKFRKILLTDSIDEELKSHFNLSCRIAQNGVTPFIEMRYAFSLYGCLLFCNGTIDLSMRVLHGLDIICCSECGESYIFADGWCEDAF